MTIYTGYAIVTFSRVGKSVTGHNTSDIHLWDLLPEVMTRLRNTTEQNITMATSQ